MASASPRLERIWIKRAKRGPMDETRAATLVAGRGLVGNANQGGHRQVTLLSAERWADVAERLGIDVAPVLRRANLLVSGVDLENARGRVLRLGSCRIRLLGETRPCERMDEAAPGLRAALQPRWGGGAYGEVIEGGDLRGGDAVAWDDADDDDPATAGHSGAGGS